MKNKNGFTLVELIVVIAIIGIISTLVVVNFNSSRIRSRDAQRVNNIHEMQTALELYYNRYKNYPTAITAGQTFSSNGIIYIDPVPTNPSPRNDGSCPNSDYTYAQSNTFQSYVITFCLGVGAADLSSGTHRAIPGSIVR